MSLSMEPELPVKITFSTPQDISDEILGGTLKFCQETGYKQNIMMFTFFWSAFLLHSKKELEENNLIEDVIKSYASSLGNLFPKVLVDNDLRKEVGDICQQNWISLTSDFSSLGVELEVFPLLQIANELNNRGTENSATFIKSDSHKTFLQIASVIKSNIYKILRQIDNQYTIQYRGIIKPQFRNIQSNYLDNHQKTQSAPTYTATKTKKTSIFPKVIAIIIAIFIGLLIIDALQSEPETRLTPVTEPKSGEILAGYEDYDGSEITISASSGDSCVVKLKTRSGATRLSFYVRAGDTVTVGVPREHLYVYFASGDTWYGQYHLFGEDTSYSMDDTICDFTKYTWEYTLYPVTSGDFSQTPINAEDF